MALRSLRERIIQTLAFELGGLAIAAPFYAALFGRSAQDSVLLVAAVTVAVLVWTPLHNTLFDLAEWRLARRVASDRPHRLPLLHAVSHETSAMIVSLPVIMLVGGHGFWTALAIDLGLSALYAAYAYLFHLAYDRLRPVVPREARSPRRPLTRGPQPRSTGQSDATSRSAIATLNRLRRRGSARNRRSVCPMPTHRRLHGGPTARNASATGGAAAQPSPAA